MAINFKFDYYHLKIDKKRSRRTDQGIQFFGNIGLDDFCKKLVTYSKNNISDFKGNGKHIVDFKDGKKWVKWVSVEFDTTNNVYKFLLTFNDIEVDPRVLEDQADNVVTQEIPDQHGQRTLLHIVIKPDSQINDANISIQNITGLKKDYLLRIFRDLTLLAYPNNADWIEKDPMTQADIKCKPNIELNAVTSDEIIEAINDGLLRNIYFVERTQSTDKFDTANYLDEEKLALTIKPNKDVSFFKNAKMEDIFQWVKNVRRNKLDKFKNTPQTYLIIQDPQTKTEVKHEFLETSIMGFTKKSILRWEDREPKTHNLLKSESPMAIPQFFSTMIKSLN